MSSVHVLHRLYVIVEASGTSGKHHQDRNGVQVPQTFRTKISLFGTFSKKIKKIN